MWLIRHGGQTVGYVVLTFDYGLEYGGREMFIDELYVRASHRAVSGRGRSP